MEPKEKRKEKDDNWAESQPIKSQPADRNKIEDQDELEANDDFENENQQDDIESDVIL